MLPLRIIPPILYGIIVYPMVGLKSESEFLIGFLIILVGFNLTAGALCLCVGIIFKDVGVGNGVATMTLLFEMLMSGLLLNSGE